MGSDGQQQQPALLAEDIHKKFADIEVLKGVSVRAARGDVIAILGASGSGKSTFLRCINLLEAPNQGRIVVGGEELRLRKGRHGALEPEDRRQVQLSLTEAGQTLLKELFGSTKDWMAGKLSGLDAGQLEEIVLGLERLQGIFR